MRVFGQQLSGPRIRPIMDAVVAARNAGCIILVLIGSSVGIPMIGRLFARKLFAPIHVPLLTCLPPADIFGPEQLQRTMMNRILTALLCFAVIASAEAQVNDKGKFQIGLGASLGLYATQFENSVTYPILGTFIEKKDDGAATVSYPIDLQIGLSKPISLGLYVEPGSYLDSNDTHTNSFLVIGISPRFYAVNKDHFAWFFHLDVGLSALRINDVENGGQRYTDSYAGGHFRLGTQVQYYFGNTFGLNFGVQYSGHNMPWRDRDPEDPNLKNANYSATLKASGVQLQLGLQVKL